MKAHTETILATMPGSCERERLLLVLCQILGEGNRMELRQQSWGEGLGWFTQSSVYMEPHQVADLRNALGIGGSKSAKPQPRSNATRLPKVFSQVSSGESFPRLVHADSA